MVCAAASAGQPADHDSTLMIFMNLSTGAPEVAPARCRYDRLVQTPSPDTAPIRRHALPVGGGHVIEVQEFGQADGTPTVVLHGGPGSGSSPLLRRGFDLSHHRVISIDQRGSGASSPRGGVEHNTTDLLLEDLRRVREMLGIAQWLVVGGSWGATLALAHAAAEPQAVSALLLRSAFLARREDIDWFFQGAAVEQPQAWQRFAQVAPPAERHGLLPWLSRTLREGTPTQQQQAALAWWQWEQALAGTTGTPPSPQSMPALIDRYRVQSHYLAHDCFFGTRPLLDRCADVPRVPTLLIHGRADRICRPEGAALLHNALPGSRLQWLDGVGHDAAHPAMLAAMTQALDPRTALA
jgi:proline iminopeptidase